MASIYKNTNATLAEEARIRRHHKYCMDNGLLDSITKQKPYAVAYGLSDNQGTRKLFRRCPVFYSAETFDAYVKKHRQIVLAVYSHRQEVTL